MDKHNIYTIQYQQLSDQIKKQQNVVERKAPSKETISKLAAAYLSGMDRNYEGWLPSTAQELYTSAKVHETTFERNFQNLNGFLLLTEGAMLKEIHCCIFKVLGVFSYEDAIDRLIDAFITAENTGNARLRFALRKYGDYFWLIALRDFYPFILKWAKNDEFLTEQIYYPSFVHLLLMFLRKWETEGFDAEKMGRYKRTLAIMLNAITEKDTPLRQELQE